MDEKKKEVAVVQQKTEGFSQITTVQQAELAGAMVAASAKAEVESAYVLAIKNPRKEEESRVNILKVCKNLKFAEAAIYRKPQGKKQVNGQWVQNYIEGLSIRFCEEAIRLWRNIKTLQATIYDDPQKRIIKITTIDLESNVSYSKDYVIEKTVERKNATGRDVVYERLNSAGEKISVVIATDDELQNKEGALGSKTIRNNGLRLIPDYILSEAVETIQATVKAKVDQDPDKAKREVIDHFSAINISVKQLEDYLAHPISEITNAEIVALRNLYNSIKSEGLTWAEIMELKKDEPKPAEVVNADREQTIKDNWGESGADHKPVDGTIKK